MVKHEVRLHAFGTRDDAPLTLVQRSDEDFIAGLLSDLGSEEGRARLRASMPAPAADGVAELYQPVHRAFHLVLAEVFCLTPGTPRFDPARIESAGLVVRRVGVPRDDRSIERVHEAWVRRPDGTKAWRSLALLDEDESLRWDPDPARRRTVSSGNAEVDRHAREHRRSLKTLARVELDDAEEHSTTLFVAPPELCKAAAKTWLYGLVPTASADTTVAPTAAYSDSDLDAVVPHYLKATGAADPTDLTPLPPDLREKTLSRYDADRLEGRPFMTMLSLLTVALGVFPREATQPPGHAAQLLAALDRITIRGEAGSAFLRKAARVLVWRTDETFTMPATWPTISPDVARAIRDAMRPSFEAQARRIIPNEGRFETARAEYVARAFIRVRCDDGCPPRVVWSRESPRFRIRPWHASGPLPPLRVMLPDIVPHRLAEVQPNVTFVVPKGLAGFLNNNTAKALLKGGGTRGDSALAWICGFNIPIITLCAFIVLSIFLSLLNIVFWWLPFVKICIPIPATLAKKMEE